MVRLTKGVMIVNKFNGENIATVMPELFLLATPFTKEPRLNFNRQLTERLFFEKIYSDGDTVSVNDFTSSNRVFENQIAQALKATDNKYAKVDLIHIEGYAGCGKTTFVHHLVWKKYGDNPVHTSIIDFEGEKEIAEPMRDAISTKISVYLSGHKEKDFLKDICQFELRRFHAGTIEQCKMLFNDICNIQNETTKDSIISMLKSQQQFFGSEKEYMYYLLVVDFLWNLSTYQDDISIPLIVIFDNVDSVNDQEQEQLFVTVLKEFINDCNFFYGMNLDNKNLFSGQRIEDIVLQMKFVCFLTTRLVTMRKLLELEPDLEKVYGWTSIKMPENYYNHLSIINKRIGYFSTLNLESESISFLNKISEFANNVYKNNIFMRLFNGNFRFSVRTLCNLIIGYGGTELIEESNSLSNDPAISQETSAGSAGMVLSILCHYLKRNGIYSDKLCLSECQPDGRISLSRIILTVLHEKDGSCNMLDLLHLLSPFFSVNEICKTVYALNEAKRDILRRMVVFDLVFPKNEDEFLNQGKQFEKGNDTLEDYSDVILCLSGKVYLESIVPHFEFMLSRHKFGNDILNNYNYTPLFSKSSEQLINDRMTGQLFGFERKIDWVYQDVYDCCINSVQFAQSVMEAFNMEREDYMNNSYFNYHSTNRDGAPGYKQSYESRLIFSQVGYIERYRRYLLYKCHESDLDFKVDINRRLVERLKRYIELYTRKGLCFQTSQQDKAAEQLLELIGIIESEKYEDFSTKIEVF